MAGGGEAWVASMADSVGAHGLAQAHRYSSLCYGGVAGITATDLCAQGAAWWLAAMVVEVLAEHAHRLFD
jgi:hypothetical protein